MRTDEFDRVLDKCLDRLARGDTVAQCVAAYPEYAPRLEPLLRIASESSDTCEFAPSPESMSRARARLRIGIADRQSTRSARNRSSILDRLTARPLPLAAITSIAVIALAVLLVAVPLSPFTPSPPATVPPQPTDTTPSESDSPTSPPETPPVDSGAPTEPPPGIDVVIAVPDEDGNFVFYLSDAPNDIGDFESLTVTIESIELKPRGSGPWVTISPQAMESDLVQLQGDAAVELWRGDVPEGDYTTAFVRISTIQGILASSGERAAVTLPSDRLHVTTDFSVVDGAATEFVFDITVHATGNAGESARYLLQPQADESGVGHSIQSVKTGMPADGTLGKPDPTPESPHGEGNSRNEDAPAPVTPPGPGPGPDSDRPRNTTALSTTA